MLRTFTRVFGRKGRSTPRCWTHCPVFAPTFTDWESCASVALPPASGRPAWVGTCRWASCRRRLTMGRPAMEIVRNADGTLVVPVQPERRHETDDDGDGSSVADGEPTQTDAAPTTRLLHPGEGGYDEALAEWDLQPNPDRGPA